MTVSEALRTRYSCRAFDGRPVPRALLTEVLEDAFRTPSCENSQPWEVYVAEGAAVEEIRQGFETCRRQKEKPVLDERFDGVWTEEMRPRIDTYFDGIYAHEERQNLDYTLQKRGLFFAPCIVYLCMDKRLPSWSMFDLGAFAQSLMLSAVEHGLDTMPAAVYISYPQVLSQVLGIPEGQKPVIGIGVGYADQSRSINTYRTQRKGTDQVKFCQEGAQ